MNNLLLELKRRNIYRVGAAYTVVAWVLIQLVSNVSPMLRLPDWAGTLVLMLLLAGFPVALLFAWIHQLAPESGTLARVTTGKLDWALIGALVVVIALVSYEQLAPRRTVESQQAGVAAARTASATQAGISIAVLPFGNLSGDAGQEFFSDGITEEITSALAKVPDLRVVARTSAYQFKAQNRDIQSIGQQLHATHFIEGSVRKAGDRVRITVQLIRADDGTHIWAEDYDRQLTDIFAIQEDIARAITTSLRMPLGLKPGENLVSNRSIDPESYQQYLHAKQLVRARSAGVVEALKILEPLVTRNPDYAPGWALLAQAYGSALNARRDNTSPDEFRRIASEYIPKRVKAAQRAIQLDANFADGYLALANVQTGPRKLLLYEELLLKLLALDPNNPDALNGYGNMLAEVGRLKEAIPVKQKLRDLEPFVPVFNGNLAEVLWLNGQDDAAIAINKETSSVQASTAVDLARMYAALGRYGDAADLLLPSGPNLRLYSAETLAEAARLLRTAPARAPSPETLPRFASLGFIYLHIGAPGRALEPFENAAEGGFFAGADIALLWHPSYAPVRKMDRFKAYVRKASLVDYWREKGWPEFCHPTAGDDFTCE